MSIIMRCLGGARGGRDGGRRRPLPVLGALGVAAALSACSSTSDVFEFTSWEGADASGERVALDTAQLEALRAERDAQIAALGDYKSIDLGLPDIDRLSAGHIAAAQRGAAALLADSASLLGGPGGEVDDALDALIAEELERVSASRAQRAAEAALAADTAAGPAIEEDDTFMIGSPVTPVATTPPAEVMAALAERQAEEAARDAALLGQAQRDAAVDSPQPPPIAEERIAVRRALARREEQAAVERQVERSNAITLDLAQRLQTARAETENVETAALGADAQPEVAPAAQTSALPAAQAPAIGGAPASRLFAPRDQTVAATARAPDASAALSPAPTAEPGAQIGAAAPQQGLAALSTTPAAPPPPDAPAAAGAAEGSGNAGAAAPTTTAAEAASAATAAAPAQNASRLRGEIHVVRSDDTLAGVAARYGSSAAAIRKANGMASTVPIYIGQELFVPRQGPMIEPPSASEALPPPIPEPRRLQSPRLSQYQSDRAPWVSPPVAGGQVTSAYGETIGDRLSTGIEISAPEGAVVAAAADGRIAYLSRNQGDLGGVILLVHSDGMISRYTRLQNIAVRHGQRIRRGARLGEIGPGGGAAPRLVFELLDGQDPVDPLQFFKAQERS